MYRFKERIFSPVLTSTFDSIVINDKSIFICKVTFCKCMLHKCLQSYAVAYEHITMKYAGELGPQNQFEDIDYIISPV